MKRTLPIVILLISFLTRLNAQSAQIPYFENFENGFNGWSTDDNGQGSAWELGTPTIGFTFGAYSGVNCWDVNLNSGYTNNSVCNLYSPVFDFTSVSRAKISFYVHYRTEFLWDYLTVQYTVDNGDNWIFLPFPYLTNPDGMAPKWIESSLVAGDLYGYPNVQFRFTFISDGSTVYDGYSIDDFRIEADPLAAPELNEEETFSVYPNPSRGEVKLQFSSLKDKNATITLFDAVGKLVLTKKAADISDQNLNISSLKKGTYNLIFESNENVSVKKLVIVGL